VTVCAECLQPIGADAIKVGRCTLHTGECFEARRQKMRDAVGDGFDWLFEEALVIAEARRRVESEEGKTG